MGMSLIRGICSGTSTEESSSDSEKSSTESSEDDSDHRIVAVK